MTDKAPPVRRHWETPAHPDDSVYFGQPVTTEEAVRAILRMLNTPIIGDTEMDSVPRLIERLGVDGSVFHMLSSGEKRLVNLATALWRAPMNDDPTLDALGGLDMDKRRKVLIILMYRYLGRDSLNAAELSASEFIKTFNFAQP